jgi:ABC-type sugar transport system ATPase subunit
VQIRAELSELLGWLGAITLYFTHDQAEAMTLGDPVAVLDRGRLQRAAPPLEPPPRALTPYCFDLRWL